VLDVLDAKALSAALAEMRPRIVVHQLTDLPRSLEPSQMKDAIPRNARVRTEGTAHLVAAAVAAGSEHMVAQSIAWAYAPGARPYEEQQPLDLSAEGPRRITVLAVAALEEAVLSSPPLRGAVLRYGNLYGPGTSTDAPIGASPVHVDAAAHAALLAVQQRAQGLYNIVEPNVTVSGRKAQVELGWSHAFRVAQ
jgi:nucleoside-diphosphate-sugar epimerase